MIDYEFKIHYLERELAHCREMQELQRTRMDTHDTGIEALHAIAKQTQETLAAVAENQRVQQQNLTHLADDIAALAQNVNLLVEALLRQPRNGAKT